MNENSGNVLSELISHKQEIIDHVARIENLLKKFFPKEHEQAYQHYIPQILTALEYNEKWLPRGEYTLQNTINNLIDKLNASQSKKGVQKYIF